MKIKLLTVGKTDQKELLNLISIYENRLRHYVKFEIDYTLDIKNNKKLSEKEQKEKEANLILNKLSSTDILILLDDKGTQYTSISFANFLQKKMNSGIKQLVFLIGGPYGFSDKIYKKASGKISLSTMTFSHQMVRLFIIEQIYRGFTILKNEPYHHQ